LAATFAVSLVALLGLPPFSLFASELGIARGGLASGHGWAVAVAFGLILVAFAAIVRHASAMLLGDPPAADGTAHRQPRSSGPAVLAAGLCVAAVVGISLGPLRHLLEAATTVVTGAAR
jgi:hydrogenase-4 component F